MLDHDDRPTFDLMEVPDMTPATRLIIDCDPGVDDALAIALALASPEVDVLAVTSVAGNATVDLTSANVGAILAACGRHDIPYAVGAERSLVHAYEHGLVPPHGVNGVGGVTLPPSPAGPVDEHAVYLLRDLLRGASRRSITIVATAPLTNIALLASLHPELLERIDRVVIMGGSAGRGNITPSAEFNTWTDPESAQRVLTDPRLRVCLVGLDVTRRATLGEAHLAELRRRGPLGSVLADMVLGYRDRTDSGWAIHDAVVIASVVDPTLLQTSPARVEVDTGTGLTRGETICEFFTADEFGEPRAAGRNRYSSAGMVDMAVGLDVNGFRSLMMNRLARPMALPT